MQHTKQELAEMKYAGARPACDGYDRSLIANPEDARRMRKLDAVIAEAACPDRKGWAWNRKKNKPRDFAAPLHQPELLKWAGKQAFWTSPGLVAMRDGSHQSCAAIFMLYTNRLADERISRMQYNSDVRDLIAIGIIGYRESKQKVAHATSAEQPVRSAAH